MNLTTILLILLVIWIVYTMLQSYRSMEKELKDIRMKCMGSASGSMMKDPMTSIKSAVVSGLTKVNEKLA